LAFENAAQVRRLNGSRSAQKRETNSRATNSSNPRCSRAQSENLNADIPRDQLVVITGFSGSKKSTPVFHIVFAEGSVISRWNRCRHMLGSASDELKTVLPNVFFSPSVLSKHG
jgi:hypothetical protein